MMEPIEDKVMSRVADRSTDLIRQGHYFAAADLILGLTDLEGNPTGRVFDFDAGLVRNPDGTVWEGWGEDE